MVLFLAVQGSNDKRSLACLMSWKRPILIQDQIEPIQSVMRITTRILVHNQLAKLVDLWWRHPIKLPNIIIIMKGVTSQQSHFLQIFAIIYMMSQTSLNTSKATFLTFCNQIEISYWIFWCHWWLPRDLWRIYKPQSLWYKIVVFICWV